MGKKAIVLLLLCVVVVVVMLKVECSSSTSINSRRLKKKKKEDEYYGVNECPLLGSDFYQNSCPEAEAIVFNWVQKAVSQDPRMAASLLRLHFHDCFVNGCDASVLLDDREGFVGEKTAAPNLNSLRGFEVIDAIKSELEFVCPQTVSCADILAIAARDSVVVSGGPSWEVQMGRRDSVSASKEAANNNLPSPNSTIDLLISKFHNVGLTLNHMVALSGAHTIGKAKCRTVRSRLQSQSSSSSSSGANVEFITQLKQLCLNNNNNNGDGDSNDVAELVLDLVTPATFDNQYYVNLLSGEGLLLSDQVIVSGKNDQARRIAETYAHQPLLFFQDFKASMLRMGSLITPSSSLSGQIRRNCRTVNN